MTSFGALQKTASLAAERSAKAALKGQGASEIGYTANNPAKVTTASSRIKSATAGAVRLSHHYLRRVRLRG